MTGTFLRLVALLTYTTWALAAHDRLFSATPKHPSLRRRGQTLAPRYNENTLYFVDDALVGAQIKLRPTLPTLILEDVEDYISRVECSETQVVIYFYDSPSFDAALSTWSDETSFAVVTSHDGCQGVNEHGVWRVQLVDTDPQLFSVTLSGRSIRLRDVSPVLTVEFGKPVMDQMHSDLLLRRREDPTNTATFTSSQTPTATFTYSSPTVSATGSSLSSNVDFSYLNTTLLPPDSSIVDLIPTPGILNNVQLSCLNCTLTGNIELIAGGFSTSDTDAEILSDFFDEGYLEFSLDGLSATMDFELAFLPGFNVFEFTAQLPSIPLGAIVIPNVLTFGPVLDLTFPIAVTLDSPVTLRTGFTLQAPSTIQIYLNMSNPESSYTTGLSGSTLDALPFTANAEDISMTLTTGFKPQLVLGAGAGVDMLNARVSGGIGVFLDLPQLAATLDVVDQANSKCEPTTSDPQDGLIRVTSGATYGGGGKWDLNVNVVGVEYENEDEVPWLSNTTALPTQCLVWDERKGSLIDAAAADTGAQSGGEGSDQGSTRNAATRTYSTKTLAVVICLATILCLA